MSLNVNRAAMELLLTASFNSAERLLFQDYERVGKSKKQRNTSMDVVMK